jgi:hypothetical protein
MSPVPSRRRVLSGLLLALVAGCSGAPGGTEGESGDTAAGSTETAATGARTSTPDATRTTTSSPDSASSPAADTGTTTEAATSGDTDLDLREANVVGVAFEGSGGSYRFDVTLYHDDDGESGYADWWQVETLDGEQLGRRTLLHAHSTAPFTRSETVSVPEGVRYVVVRGHDQTHGYGGQAMVVDLETGTSEPVRQGAEPREFSGDEPDG